MDKRFFTLPVLLLWILSGMAQQKHMADRLHVSADGHFLEHADGAPFFWLGDTGWELFHRLSREEIKSYLDNRAAKGFTVIQAVALAEMDGLRTPNVYGQIPFDNQDPAKPNNVYFSLIDSTIAWAMQRNLYIGLLPTWGDKVTQLWGAGPVVFDSAKAYAYGKWIGSRYKNNTNIIWILGGDRPAARENEDWRPVWRAMAAGIKSATGNKCLIAYHPSGGSSSSQWLHNEPWLNINTFQSGHGNGHDVACWDLVTKDRGLNPAKPTLDAEPNYEDHPVSPWPKWNPDNGYFRAYDVRKQLYRSVFAGACGVTYGHHAIWQFMGDKQEAINYPDRGWKNAMDRPGAFQAGYLCRLMQEYPSANQQPNNKLIASANGEKGTYQQACQSADGKIAMVYLPVGTEIKIDLNFLKGKTVNATWFDPRTGKKQATQAVSGREIHAFTPPALGVENDWVLLLQAI
jgi:hypothetical protein